MKENYWKFTKNLTSFLFSNPISFYGNYCEKKRDWNESPIPFQVLKCPFFNDPLQDVRFCFFYIAHQCTEKNPNVRWRSPVLNLNYAKTLLSPLENGIFSVKIVILFIHANQKNKEHLEYCHRFSVINLDKQISLPFLDWWALFLNKSHCRRTALCSASVIIWPDHFLIRRGFWVI